MSDQKKTPKKEHDCPEKKWVDEVYRPWYEQNVKEGEVSTDEGSSPPPPPPPPPHP